MSLRGIDCTNECLFLGDEDPNELQRHHYLYHCMRTHKTTDVFLEYGFNHLARRIANIVSIEQYESVFGSDFFRDPREDKFIEHWESFYFDTFGYPPVGMEHTDPLAHFLFTSGLVCDRCGIELNLLNRSASSRFEFSGICEQCDSDMKDEDTNFEII